jgi:hypothetical protein
MTRLFSLGAVGLLGAGLMLATPEQSHAQALGVNVNVGHSGFSFYTGPQYVAPVTPYVVPPAPVGVYVNPVAPYYRDPCLTWPYTVYPTYSRYPVRAWHYDHHRDHHGHHHR